MRRPGVECVPCAASAGTGGNIFLASSSTRSGRVPIYRGLVRIRELYGGPPKVNRGFIANSSTPYRKINQTDKFNRILTNVKPVLTFCCLYDCIMLWEQHLDWMLNTTLAQPYRAPLVA